MENITKYYFTRILSLLNIFREEGAYDKKDVFLRALKFGHKTA